MQLPARSLSPEVQDCHIALKLIRWSVLVVFGHMVCPLVSLFSGLRVLLRVVALADSVDTRVPQSIAALHDELHLFILIWQSSLLLRIRYALPVFSSHIIPSATFILN